MSLDTAAIRQRLAAATTPGTRAVEPYSREAAIVVLHDTAVVLARPDDLPESWADEHNCDEQGCGSAGPHVVGRFYRGPRAEFARHAFADLTTLCDEVDRLRALLARVARGWAMDREHMSERGCEPLPDHACAQCVDDPLVFDEDAEPFVCAWHRLQAEVAATGPSLDETHLPDPSEY